MAADLKSRRSALSTATTIYERSQTKDSILLDIEANVVTGGWPPRPARDAPRRT